VEYNRAKADKRIVTGLVDIQVFRGRLHGRLLDLIKRKPTSPGAS